MALSVKTHHAIRSVLNHCRDTIKQLLGSGVLDEVDAELLLNVRTCTPSYFNFSLLSLGQSCLRSFMATAESVILHLYVIRGLRIRNQLTGNFVCLHCVIVVLI